MINSVIFQHVLFSAFTIFWRISSPLLAEISPLNKEVVRVHPGSEVQYDPAKQYPLTDFIELVEKHGYEAEEYYVTTKDGYILRLHRISAGPHNPKVPGKPVVFLQHGLGFTSDCWVDVGPNSDLAFLLVDAGYDVWLGNNRGNDYSRGHVSKDPNSKSYWQFSYHEMGIYDLPASIDAILNKTGAENLTYLGFSMGTLTSYVLLSTLPEYNDKINMVYSVAPVAYWNSALRRVPRQLISFSDLIFAGTEYYHIHGLFPQNALVLEMGKKFCGDDNKVMQSLCSKMYGIFGIDNERMNKTGLPYYLASFPKGIARLTLWHLFQNMDRKTFQAFDYGADINLMKYGQKEAPFYNLTKITAPISLWYAQKDEYVNPKDVLALSKDLPNVVSVNVVEYENFNHLDFMWAKDARKLVYDKLSLLNQN